jgi:two-component system heavy metal sensor histidine kinase CusS
MARPFSLAARLTAWYGASAFLLIVLTTAFLYWALVTNLDREDDEFLADKIHFLQTLLAEQETNHLMLKEEVELEPAARRHVQVFVRIVIPDDEFTLETPGMDALLPESLFQGDNAEQTEPRPGMEVTTPDGQSFRLASAQGEINGRKVDIQVALDRTREEDLLSSYRRWLWLLLGLALVICGAVGHQIARRGLRPLASITRAAERIRLTTLHEHIETQGLPAELFVLATRFNEMLTRLQEAFERLERFSADIAHELRNPVNNLRGEAEVALSQPRSPQAYRQVLSSCLEEYSRLSHLIDSLLFIARADSPRTQINRERLEISEELAAVREFFEAAAAEAGILLQVQAPRGLTAHLDRTLLRNALANLVANALAHTPRGGTVTLMAVPEGEAVRIEVADTGCGIAVEHLAHVFDRFYRVDSSRTGDTRRVGLGLAIVRSIAVLHQGSAGIASAPGRGTRVTLLLPNELGQ